MSETTPSYQPKNHVRIVTAASLFDGHDAAINIMRRIMQASGCEVIHLGHNRSVQEIVDCAIQEDANAIAITSYQGGHIEFFKYMYDLLQEQGADHIKIYGGGGGTILPDEIKELHDYGITRIYSPDDGRKMGLQGMINDLIKGVDFSAGEKLNGYDPSITVKDKKEIAHLISSMENFPDQNKDFSEKVKGHGQAPVLGITGTGGAGKSSLVDELVRRYLEDFDDKTIAVISVDPSKRKSGGALLGDRIRMNSIFNDRVYMRSLATRQSNLALSRYVGEAVEIVKSAGYDLIILETSGIGQSDTEITDHSDVSLYVMTPEYGAASQLEKIDMLDFADIIALNKFDKRGAQDALRDIKKQYTRNHQLWDTPDDQLPVYGTIASQFNDPGMNRLYHELMKLLTNKSGLDFLSKAHLQDLNAEKIYIIPPGRTRYLSEITDTIRGYNEQASRQSKIAQQLYSIQETEKLLQPGTQAKEELNMIREDLQQKLHPENKALIDGWKETKEKYSGSSYTYEVRGKEFTVKTSFESLSGTQVQRISLPRFEGWGDILRWQLQENVPGVFPFTAGVFPFKRESEDPTRMFAGEGGPERTNKRFHYLSEGLPAARLSTAFDSVTLYGEDPDPRPDIYGKIGNSGVSVCSLDDAKKLYSGFNLCDPSTSVSMTING
ncbi:MAG: methylmalonyl-CoA mutase family protein, partial [Cyclobacteriaceae bacterium]|nr:methylmalonyl-CoA mutase family protein [Cyclobacteriaceae bacterium SS2]